MKTIANVKVVAKYHKEWDETFIHPDNESGKFNGAEFTAVAEQLASLGYDLTGGHEYYVPVAGRVKWANA